MYATTKHWIAIQSAGVHEIVGVGTQSRDTLGEGCSGQLPAVGPRLPRGCLPEMRKKCMNCSDVEAEHIQRTSELNEALQGATVGEHRVKTQAAYLEVGEKSASQSIASAPRKKVCPSVGWSSHLPDCAHSENVLPRQYSTG